jgi:hypothetical protein
MIKSLLIIGGLIVLCAVAVLIVFISFLNEKNKKIQKELREDGYYD